ncbi:alpha/beta hydrolase [Sphingosinicella sp. CPCC 101087]|uniref:alpha/beta hydrolase n=1 Tax=Sphingosinicella sp. CPCC 101087 TaxID=2497754 RepID=UPI001FB12FF5|nr:alpha/beta fold hydrolase [Sphingosinicella sp. CPCC 101087]
MTWRIGVLAPLMLAASGASAAAQAPAPELRLEPYAFRLADGAEMAAERGTFSVPEDRNDAASRPIEIGFVRFRSTNPNPGAPIVYLAGGPGGSGVDTARGPRQPIFLALRQVADVIALDQRGVGLSNHVPPCTAEQALDPERILNEQTLAAYYRDTFVACVGRWRAAGVAIERYTTEQSADDLEDLRRALGAERIDLWGISYGTHLALAAMRRHPGSIGRVALASIEGMHQTVKLPAHADAAFARIGAALGSDLPALMRRVHARFDTEPQSVALSSQGREIAVRADSFTLRMMAGFLAKNPSGLAELARLYSALEVGRTEPLAPLLAQFFYRRPLTLSGMPELMDVASGIGEARLAEVLRQAPRSISGTALNFPMPQLRGAVPGLELGEAFRREVGAGHPVLWLAGELDVRTPLEEQEIAAAGLRNRHRIVVRNGGHDLFEAHPDVAPLLVDFFSGRRVAVTELSLPVPTAP